eukprot:SAG11_NODE_3857_length_2189_cov_4.381340_2_plen_154_part_00
MWRTLLLAARRGAPRAARVQWYTATTTTAEVAAAPSLSPTSQLAHRSTLGALVSVNLAVTAGWLYAGLENNDLVGKARGTGGDSPSLESMRHIFLHDQRWVSEWRLWACLTPSFSHASLPELLCNMGVLCVSQSGCHVQAQLRCMHGQLTCVR